MAGPIRVFQFLSDAELAALRATIVAQLTGGRFTNLGGAQKSASIEWMDLNAQLQALNLEINIRAGVRRPQKVVQVLSHFGCLYPGQ
jgi:hypothetical protein